MAVINTVYQAVLAPCRSLAREAELVVACATAPQCDGPRGTRAGADGSLCPCVLPVLCGSPVLGSGD